MTVGIFRRPGDRADEEDSLEELAELAASAGAQVVDSFLQRRNPLDPACLLGRGKLEEIAGRILDAEADLVVFDLELSPTQARNLEKRLETRVIDRSELILDIFAQRARSRTGKLQVELAQLEYLLPRLSGRGTALSRLGGGIGTRGPGETQLERDRRRIRNRIAAVRTQLNRLQKRRALQRGRRQAIPIPAVSLVGYTNAGKSTLFNRLTHASAPTSRRMFATLDPLVRSLQLPSGREILVTDTVGFVRKLPHTLVAAFHATLEEALEADLILLVNDVSHPARAAMKREVYRVLAEIGGQEVPVLEVENKIDLLREKGGPVSRGSGNPVSALTGEGIGRLLQRLEHVLSSSLRPVQLRIPLGRGEVVSRLRLRGRVQSQEYREDGVYLSALLGVADRRRYRQFLVPGETARQREEAETRNESR